MPSRRLNIAAPLARPWFPTNTSAWSFVVPAGNVASGSSMVTHSTPYVTPGVWPWSSVAFETPSILSICSCPPSRNSRTVIGFCGAM